MFVGKIHDSFPYQLSITAGFTLPRFSCEEDNRDSVEQSRRHGGDLGA